MKTRRWGDFPEKVLYAAKEKAQYCCERCGKRHNLSVHHKAPLYWLDRNKIRFPLPEHLVSSLHNAEVLCTGPFSCHGEADQDTPENEKRYEIVAQLLLGMFHHQNEKKRSTR